VRRILSRPPGAAKSLLVLGGIGILAGFYVASATSGPSTRIFSANFGPPTTFAGGTLNASLPFQICNTGSSQLGSVDVTAPADFTIGSTSPLPGSGSTLASSTLIQLRNLSLNPGTCLSPITMVVDVPCPPGDYQWTLAGRQQGDFTGQSFTLDEAASNRVTHVTKACTLVITTEPASAETSTAITDVPYNDPAPGNSVTVEARNSAGDLVGSAHENVTLDATGTFTCCLTGAGFTGNTSALLVGTASFPSLQSDRTGTGFVLTARATGYFDSAPSGGFDIVLDGRRCPGASCHVETPSGHTFAASDGSGTTVNDTLGIGLLDYDVFQVPTGVCDPLDGPAFQPLPDSNGFFMSVHVAGVEQPDYTIRVIFDKSIVQKIPDNSTKAVQACFGALRLDSTGAPIPCSFDTLGGFPTVNSPDPLNPLHARCDATTQLWWGLLPNAGPGINVCTDARLTDPVVLSRNRTSRPSGLVITLCKPYPWDEKGAFG
jgi:hypothetical protein